MVRDYRSKGGLIAFAPDPKTGHETGDSRYLAIPFFDACLGLRLPDKAGGADLKPIDTGISAYRPLHENYVDPKVDGTAHDYQVIVINSVGLRSK